VGAVIAMAANVRLREALMRAGLTPASAAERLEVDPKTVERWVTKGRAPYPRHRYALAALVGVSETDLWPESAQVLRPARLSFAGVCIWCEGRDCSSADCVARHEGSAWQVCPTCEGTPWTRAGGCACLFGLTERVKFATAPVSGGSFRVVA